MSTNISLTAFAKATINNDTYRIGGDSAVSVAAASETVFHRLITLADTETVQLDVGAAATDEIADFNFLMAVADKDCKIKITDDQGTPDSITIGLSADVPFILGRSTDGTNNIAQVLITSQAASTVVEIIAFT